ncbi:hypothetical protein SAMN04487936_103320 [Halobacillus dabanensis]|uniref:Uncharacterized protein n=1 Tax=Halobacillus dabanensis TaxID=240302 RepID=A0A1I3TD60_HALDA|nr:hypothetical protein SAMN04487936_103320 [Halobacillus dabanensis]
MFLPQYSKIILNKNLSGGIIAKHPHIHVTMQLEKYTNNLLV